MDKPICALCISEIKHGENQWLTVIVFSYNLPTVQASKVHTNAYIIIFILLG